MDGSHLKLYFSNMDTETEPPIVPPYGLYGETLGFPDILHYEKTPWRARFYGHIAPHSHPNLHQFFILRTGGGTVTLDGGRYNLADDMVLNVPPGCVHAIAFDERSVGSVITVPREVLDEARLPRQALAAIASPKTLFASPSIWRCVETVQQEYGEGSSTLRSAILRHMSALLALNIARMTPAGVGMHDDAPPPNANTRLVRRFTALVEEHFRNHWPIARYASTLGVSATHLGRVVRAGTGSTPRMIVSARLLVEARRHLAYTNRPVQQIAENLGFADPAYFTRVIQRKTGLSPTELRRRLKGSSPAVAADKRA